MAARAQHEQHTNDTRRMLPPAAGSGNGPNGAKGTHDTGLVMRPVPAPKKRGPKPGRLLRSPAMSAMSKAPATATTLTHLVNAYLDDLQVRNYKPKTIHGYAKNLATFVTWGATQGHGATTLADLNAELLRAYIRYLQQKPKWAERDYTVRTTEHVSASAIRNYVRDVKTFAAWLAEEHYTPVHVLASVKTPKADETPGLLAQPAAPLSVYAGSTDGSVLALDAVSGAVRWHSFSLL